MVSVICVFNNEKQFENQLGSSLKCQNVEIELIKIDNRGKKYQSAAAALNYGANKAKGDILIFSHQDIYLKTKSEIKELAEAINKCEVGSVVGTQGVLEKNKDYYSNLTAGEQLNTRLNNMFEKKLYKVSCIDEGLFGMKKETWREHQFDEKICDNWHLYAVEQCLFARSHGTNVYVYPSQIHHFSKGRISLGYMQNLRELCKKYRSSFKYIWTTCYKVRTNPIYINGLVAVWCLNRLIRGKSLK